MAKFQFLPAETKFYEWFEKATGNLLEAATALQDMFDHYENVEAKVAHITELEHRGDFIVHEVMHLLMHTLIIPLDSEDIERLISALDDAIDGIEATAVRMVIFQIETPTERARQLAQLIRSGAQELHQAMPVAGDDYRPSCPQPVPEKLLAAIESVRMGERARAAALIPARSAGLSPCHSGSILPAKWQCGTRLT